MVWEGSCVSLLSSAKIIVSGKMFEIRGTVLLLLLCEIYPRSCLFHYSMI